MEQDHQATRRFFIKTWRKYQQGVLLQPLESLIVGVIIQHPEYHQLLEDEASTVEAEFDPEAGESNPFLHMGLHITIQEQFGADRPPGFRELYETGLQKLGDQHLLEHRLMECLGEILWRAQREQSMPDEAAYLEAVRRIVGFM